MAGCSEALKGGQQWVGEVRAPWGWTLFIEARTEPDSSKAAMKSSFLQAASIVKKSSWFQRCDPWSKLFGDFTNLYHNSFLHKQYSKEVYWRRSQLSGGTSKESTDLHWQMLLFSLSVSPCHSVIALVQVIYQVFKVLDEIGAWADLQFVCFFMYLPFEGSIFHPKSRWHPTANENGTSHGLAGSIQYLLKTRWQQKDQFYHMVTLAWSIFAWDPIPKAATKKSAASGRLMRILNHFDGFDSLFCQCGRLPWYAWWRASTLDQRSINQSQWTWMFFWKDHVNMTEATDVSELPSERLWCGWPSQMVRPKSLSLWGFFLNNFEVSPLWVPLPFDYFWISRCPKSRSDRTALWGPGKFARGLLRGILRCPGLRVLERTNNKRRLGTFLWDEKKGKTNVFDVFFGCRLLLHTSFRESERASVIVAEFFWGRYRFSSGLFWTLFFKTMSHLSLFFLCSVSCWHSKFCFLVRQEVSPCGEKVTAWKISSKPSDPVTWLVEVMGRMGRVFCFFSD